MEVVIEQLISVYGIRTGDTKFQGEKSRAQLALNTRECFEPISSLSVVIIEWGVVGKEEGEVKGADELQRVSWNNLYEKLARGVTCAFFVIDKAIVIDIITMVASFSDATLSRVNGVVAEEDEPRIRAEGPAD